MRAGEYAGPSWWPVKLLRETGHAGVRRLGLVWLTVGAIAIVLAILEARLNWSGIPDPAGRRDRRPHRLSPALLLPAARDLARPDVGHHSRIRRRPHQRAHRRPHPSAVAHLRLCHAGRGAHRLGHHGAPPDPSRPAPQPRPRPLRRHRPRGRCRIVARRPDLDRGAPARRAVGRAHLAGLAGGRLPGDGGARAHRAAALRAERAHVDR